MLQNVLKIGLVTPYPFAQKGGVNWNLYNMHNAITEMGHTVKIIAPAPGMPEGIPKENVIRVGRSVPLSFNGSDVSSNIRFRLGQISKILKEEKFHIIHMNNMDFGLIWSRKIALEAHRLGIPVILTWHGTLDRSIFAGLLPASLEFLYGKLISRIIAVSPPACAALSKFSIPSKVIPNGIDLTDFRHNAPILQSIKHQFMDGRPNVLFVGRLEDRKGPDKLISSIGDVRWKIPDVRLIMVGKGRLRPRIEAAIAEHGLENNVCLVGAVSHKELLSYYGVADLFCAPSLGGESQGLVLLEAMAKKVLTVAGYNPGYATIFEAEKGIDFDPSNIMPDPRDRIALSQAIIRGLTDKDFIADQLQWQNARVRNEMYRWPIIAKQILEIYKEVLEERARGQ
jgi:phosphatidyl-myo-inositol alpha-mannosyltransferase